MSLGPGELNDMNSPFCHICVQFHFVILEMKCRNWKYNCNKYFACLLSQKKGRPHLIISHFLRIFRRGFHRRDIPWTARRVPWRRQPQPVPNPRVRVWEGCQWHGREQRLHSSGDELESRCLSELPAPSSPLLRDTSGPVTSPLHCTWWWGRCWRQGWWWWGF